MQYQSFKRIEEAPDFLLKTSFHITLIASFIVTPFCVANFIYGRNVLGILTFVIVILCALNSWLCKQHRYNLSINLLGISLLVVIAILYAVYTLDIKGSYWAYMGVVSFYAILPKDYADRVVLIFLILLLPVSFQSLESSIFIRFFVVLIGVSFFSSVTFKLITEQCFLLQQQAITDPLTGLMNRSLLQTSIEQAIHQYNRVESPMALAMIDVDHFKSINDEFGHAVGDDVLKKLGKFLSVQFRGSDMVFRIGGEEILVLIQNVEHANAVVVAEKLRTDIENLSLIDAKSVTVSIGISVFNKGLNWSQWIKECDDNLYKAKTNGRNKVVG